MRYFLDPQKEDSGDTMILRDHKVPQQYCEYVIAYLDQGYRAETFGILKQIGFYGAWITPDESTGNWKIAVRDMDAFISKDPERIRKVKVNHDWASPS